MKLLRILRSKRIKGELSRQEAKLKLITEKYNHKLSQQQKASLFVEKNEIK